MFDHMHMEGKQTGSQEGGGVFKKGAGSSPEAETHLREQQRRPAFGKCLYSPQHDFKTLRMNA